MCERTCVRAQTDASVDIEEHKHVCSSAENTHTDTDRLADLDDPESTSL